ncbi:Staphyloferrin B transporter [Rubrobacter xylanophilus DSM 9941]|uniref:MFS transporter n=1 Tax=Rubrobacter xylanophilus TaxID=49319 RepID=UPI001C640E5D|nr:MFS transporter [Rubrobacter xylanophilus]QYJ16735.1 Staphyloferrin B transporter [Rubrobacter xylanophilus DSM 9941]
MPGFLRRDRLSFLILLVSQFAATTGFMFVMPFMPLYVQQLGVEDPGRAAAWAGLLNTATAATMALAAPLWGRLADRFGPKPMLLRATFAGAVVVGMMGLAASPWHLLGLRLLQGTLTGTVAAATLLVAATAPPGRAGLRLGTLQTVIFAAAAAGPFLGGVFADFVGIRASFGVTSGLLALSAVLVLFGVDGARAPSGEEETRKEGGAVPWLGLVPVLAALFVVQASNTGVAPALPGFVAELMEEPAGVASLAGQILGAGALAAALGSAVGGRLAERLGTRTVIFCSLVLGGLAFLPQAAVSSVGALWVLRILASFFIGAVVPVANLAVRRSVPPGRQGRAFGVAASVTSVAFGVGPLGGGLLASAFGFEAAFLVPGVLLLAAAGVLLLAPGSRVRAVRVLKAAAAHIIR